jgi:hypothetical protein
MTHQTDETGQTSQMFYIRWEHPNQIKNFRTL